MTTRAEAIEAAGAVLARGIAYQASLPPRQAAELAWRPGGLSLDEIEHRIRAQRGLPLVDDQHASQPEPCPAPYSTTDR